MFATLFFLVLTRRIIHRNMSGVIKATVEQLAQSDTTKDVTETLQKPLLVQYILIRGDLQQTMKWPTGAVIAQACHASTAAIHLFYSDESTQSYLRNIDRMHKVILKATDEASLKEVEEKLNSDGIGHKMWIEQPENFPTCLATRPYPKEQVQQYFKGFKLFR